ncbi:hypothetical protein [uncultured Roseibium sp.]|uniref:hypothetical protein n=1 Tax=uncultured Roseibium sp. TaxID=1936171 RepID=UPI00262B9EE9|nr:hypothetical protein [uncultured Roseibium sp.]
MPKSGKNRQKPRPDDKILEEFLRRFLKYEVDMLRATHILILNSPDSQIVINVLIESFCIHARNIIEFLKNHGACDVDPRWFTGENYKVDRNFLKKSLGDRVNAQIAHLSHNRTTDSKKKIDAKDRKELSDAVELQLSRFYNNLKVEWRKCCGFKPEINQISAKCHSDAATNNIEEVRSTSLVEIDEQSGVLIYNTSDDRS